MNDKTFRISSQPDLMDMANKPLYNITVFHSGKSIFAENTYNKDIITTLEKLLKKQGYKKLGGER